MARTLPGGRSSYRKTFYRSSGTDMVPSSKEAQKKARQKTKNFMCWNCTSVRTHERPGLVPLHPAYPYPYMLMYPYHLSWTWRRTCLSYTPLTASSVAASSFAAAPAAAAAALARACGSPECSPCPRPPPPPRRQSTTAQIAPGSSRQRHQCRRVRGRAALLPRAAPLPPARAPSRTRFPRRRSTGRRG